MAILFSLLLTVLAVSSFTFFDYPGSLILLVLAVLIISHLLCVEFLTRVDLFIFDQLLEEITVFQIICGGYILAESYWYWANSQNLDLLLQKILMTVGAGLLLFIAYIIYRDVFYLFALALFIAISSFRIIKGAVILPDTVIINMIISFIGAYIISWNSKTTGAEQKLSMNINTQGIWIVIFLMAGILLVY